MTADLVPVSVPGADIPIHAAVFDRRAWVAFRPLCDALGVDPDTQAKKLRNRSWATTVLKTVVAADGRTREMLMVDRRTLTMWLATLDEHRVAEGARDRVIAYQAEAADAINAFFNQRALESTVNQFDVLRAAIDQIEAAHREAAEARAIAARTEARLDGIEGRHDWFSALGYAKSKGLPTEQGVRVLPGQACGVDREDPRNLPTSCAAPALRRCEQFSDLGVGPRRGTGLIMISSLNPRSEVAAQRPVAEPYLRSRLRDGTSAGLKAAGEWAMTDGQIRAAIAAMSTDARPTEVPSPAGLSKNSRFGRRLKAKAASPRRERSDPSHRPSAQSGGDGW